MIRTRGLGKRFGDTMVLQDLDFDMERGEIVTIIGRSGSGKSTFLDIIMGLTQPTSGSVVRRADDKSVSYIFQRPALLPWRTVMRNVGLPLEVANVKRHIREQRILHALNQVGMAYAASLFPFQLSGGMAQRVAIARALVQEPDLLLMDEPFSALDPLLRENMNINLLKLWHRTKKTILFVTHSIDEAVILSDRILVLEGGRLIFNIDIEIPRPRSEETFHTHAFAETVRRIRAHLPFQANKPRASQS